ncbi:NAD(P)H-hydrate dehydratase [Blattabacterium cuenoti]|uniref:NAD(P)H-hydrate dehydratase n=1 Tax=Blattabacterium cuenoti TaxID=1653831 RepID=UPI00163CAA79|nr:NAD(P)H-hydrate dehydratase [Blattabacterium cuenoti]
MKILSAKQIKQADQHCIDYESISSIELMERSAKKCFNWIIKNLYFLELKKFPFIILAGNGNNGGDGLSLARLLHLQGFKIITYILNVSNFSSKEFLLSKNKIIEKIKIKNIYENDNFPIINKKSYLIDAIFGIGLNRPINKYWKSFIDFINDLKLKSVISIDVPSGLFIEKKNNNIKGIIKSDYTLTFQVPKLPFLLPDYEIFVGNWHLLNIGWKEEFICKMNSKKFLIDKKEICFNKNRKKFSHKGNYGHGFIIGGSYGMIGSVVLSGKASFCCGIGKLSIYIPRCGYQIVQNTILESIVITDKKENFISNIYIPDNINAIGIGMGMGQNYYTIQAFNSFLKLCKKGDPPMIFDADAINILSKNKSNLLKLIPSGTILTPHPKEFKRLFGSWKDDYDKLDMLKNISKKYGIFIVLKGAHTIISTPNEELYFNNTGNAGMATAGSGDVLTGMILGFLSQGYSSKDSCIISVYLHGISGDIAAKKVGMCSLRSTDIINCIAKSFNKI